MSDLLGRIRAAAGAWSGYSVANDSRYRSHQAWNRSREGTEEKALTAFARRSARLETRDLYRNNEITHGAVDRVVDYAIWMGIWPNPNTEDKDWNKLTKDWWRDIYVPTADFRQINGVDLTTLQRLTLSHRYIDGDVGYIMLANGQVQPIESVRICTPDKFQKDPKVVEGVKRSAKGLVQGYFICDRRDGGSIDTTSAKFVRRENFIFCSSPGRIDQIRGVPDLAPVANKLRDYDTTDQNVMNKVKLDSMQQFKRFTASGAPNERARESYRVDDSNDQDQQRVTKHEWGNVHHMRHKDDMESFGSNTPNQQYVPYLKHELQAVAMALKLPYEYLMLIFTDGSFSAQRAAMLHANRTFRQEHQWVVNSFLDRLYNWRIAKAMKDGVLPPAPLVNGVSQWFRKEWSLPHFEWIDPEKQAKGDVARYNMGQTSLTRIIASQGSERDTIFAEKQSDIAKAIDIAAKLNDGHPEALVTWRDMITTESPLVQASTTPKVGEIPAEDVTDET